MESQIMLFERQLLECEEFEFTIERITAFKNIIT
jgi:hypothetical protein